MVRRQVSAAYGTTNDDVSPSVSIVTTTYELPDPIIVLSTTSHRVTVAWTSSSHDVIAHRFQIAEVCNHLRWSTSAYCTPTCLVCTRYTVFYRDIFCVFRAAIRLCTGKTMTHASHIRVTSHVTQQRSMIFSLIRNTKSV